MTARIFLKASKKYKWHITHRGGPRLGNSTHHQLCQAENPIAHQEFEVKWNKRRTLIKRNREIFQRHNQEIITLQEQWNKRLNLFLKFGKQTEMKKNSLSGWFYFKRFNLP